MVRRCRNGTLGGAAVRGHMCGMSETEAKPKPEEKAVEKPPAPPMPKEVGGPKGPEPTRYGDWEQKGRCTDF